jgi:hypothetical protein
MNPHANIRSLLPTALMATCTLALAATFSLPLSAPSTAAQGLKHGMPTPPESAQNNSNKTATPQPNPAAKHAQLIRNEKEFRDGLERLCQLTMELRQEVQQTPTSAVLSIPMVKKTEAIEKLAKQLKNKAKGS